MTEIDHFNTLRGIFLANGTVVVFNPYYSTQITIASCSMERNIRFTVILRKDVNQILKDSVITKSLSLYISFFSTLGTTICFWRTTY